MTLKKYNKFYHNLLIKLRKNITQIKSKTVMNLYISIKFILLL